MRFFVKLEERDTRDQQERAAMLKHRLASIKYQQDLVTTGKLHYAFKTESLTTSYLLYTVDSLIELDKLIKRDPLWVYSTTTVTPVTSTKDMVAEAADFLGEPILTDVELMRLDTQIHPIDQDEVHTLAAKSLSALNPLTDQETQNEIWRRTLESQRLHANPIEYCDDNPVGQPYGILIGKASPDELRAHVSAAPIHPDTNVEYIPLKTLKQAWEASDQQISSLNRLNTFSNPFLE